MRYEINLRCETCDSLGKIEHQRSETLFSDSVCSDCRGEKFKVYYDNYDTEEDCRADYPDAMVRELYNV